MSGGKTRPTTPDGGTWGAEREAGPGHWKAHGSDQGEARP